MKPDWRNYTDRFGRDIHIQNGPGQSIDIMWNFIKGSWDFYHNDELISGDYAEREQACDFAETYLGGQHANH